MPESRLNPDIKKADVGVRELKTLTIYPLSAAFQMNLAEDVSDLLVSFFAVKVKDLLKMDDWNTIKVKAQGSVYTMWLNGEEVLTYDSDTAIEKGPIGIQLHPGRDMHIDYKNIKPAEI